MNRLPLEPQINQDASFMYALKARLREIARLLNSTADQVDSHTTSIAGKVNRAGDTMTGGLNLVSPSTSATEASTDNSTRIATTAWAKVGLVVSLGVTGYIKFPTWLGGGLVIQWGSTVVTSNGAALATFSFPFTFPATYYTMIAYNGDNSAASANKTAMYAQTGITTSVARLVLIDSTTGSGLASATARVNWVAFGN
jgi:hypothetical protein